ncbi:MAG: ABC transporter permease [Nitrospirae bacterium]|nr:ABC transporter permease [Nitrospirota bacterium]MCL5237811.1 ABC transporter permease [Nitrospirota bacterium]
MPDEYVLSERPEYIRETLDAGKIGDIRQPLTLWEKISNISVLRKSVILLLLAALWQGYALWADNPLIFPTFKDTIIAFFDALVHGGLLSRTMVSLKLLVMGYAAGIALATVMTIFAVSSRIGSDFLDTLTSMFNPLPAIALLPLSLLWFGLGNFSIIFVLIHSVLWPVSLNMHSGFRGVSNTLRMVGHNYGLSGWGYISKILVPAAFPSILTGIKIGWAFAWRTLIAAELVFGVSSGQGGLGWFIYENKNEMEVAYVFAGLLTVILIGISVENLIFRNIENRTVRKWGMCVLSE